MTSLGLATRRLVLVGGDEIRAERWLLGRLSARQLAAGLWVAESAPAGIQPTPAAKVSQCLGGEYPVMVYNAHQGFHPDAFAAAVGTLRGGGDCLVLAPALRDWPGFADPDKVRFACYPRHPADMHGFFLERLARIWRANPAVQSVEPDAGLALRPAAPSAAVLRLNDEQQAAVAAVERVAHGHARRPLVLTADRGRGKSTVLGVAAARLLAGGLKRVTVVAPGRAAVATLFRHALAAVGRSGEVVADTSVGGGSLCFRLPADCMRHEPNGLGLVMVDEAAAVPVAILERLLTASNRLVFASTVHGYEGSGRGFELRFRSVLQQVMPQWRAMRLSAPVRWAEDDPLEALVNETFLLDAELAGVQPHAAVSIEAIEPSGLALDEALLRSAFALLINAHYQTRPSDLRQLLDNPDVHLWLARTGDTVVGVLLASDEGGFDPDMAAQILSGRRRPHGHLLPQSLAVHAGLDRILRLRTLRIQRIAVHPELQRQGIGRRLLERAAEWAARRRYDLLGTAYGIERSLLSFWQAAGYVAVRLGVRVDPASAAHSLFMLRGLCAAGNELAASARHDFQAGLPWALAASLGDLDSYLAVQLLRGLECSDLALSVADETAVKRIAEGVRQPATAEAAVWKAVLNLAARGAPPAPELAPILAWRVQRRSAADVCREFSIAGRRELEACLRSVFQEV
jgi:tRNA(Met) cytidine acetyltransferase